MKTLKKYFLDVLEQLPKEDYGGRGFERGGGAIFNCARKQPRYNETGIGN